MSDNLETVEMPRGIDDPHIVIIWPMDEMIIMCVFFGAAILFDHPILGGVLAVMLAKRYADFNARRQDGVLIHVTYWYGLLPLNGFSFKNPFVQRWLP